MNALSSIYDEVSRWQNKATTDRFRVFDGSGAKLACLDRMVSTAMDRCRGTPYFHDCETVKEDGYWMNRKSWGIDDSIMFNFFEPGPIQGYMMLSYTSSGMSCFMGNLSEANCWWLRNVRQPYHLKARFMDRNCNLITNLDPNLVCGNVTLNMMVSPISLEWTEAPKVTSSLVKFALKPGTTKVWVQWRSGAEFPLLVTDTNGNGSIDDGSELLGEWTFGGKQLDGGVNTRIPWRHGFEALSSFDQDSSGIVEGAELQKLSLWFDRNSNAETESDELVTAEAAGIEGLIIQEPQELPGSKDLVTRATVRRSGKAEASTMIDWYSPIFESPSEALSNPLPVINNGEPVSGTAASIPTTSSDDSIRGFWAWSIQGSSEAQGINGGVLMLYKSGEKIAGLAFSESIVVPANGSSARSLIQSQPLFGVEKGTEVVFVVPGDAQTTYSSMVLSENGELNGVSTVKTLNDEQIITSYRWNAKRLR